MCRLRKLQKCRKLEESIKALQLLVQAQHVSRLPPLSTACNRHPCCAATSCAVKITCGERDSTGPHRTQQGDIFRLWRRCHIAGRISRAVVLQLPESRMEMAFASDVRNTVHQLMPIPQRRAPQHECLPRLSAAATAENRKLMRVSRVISQAHWTMLDTCDIRLVAASMDAFCTGEGDLYLTNRIDGLSSLAPECGVVFVDFSFRLHFKPACGPPLS